GFRRGLVLIVRGAYRGCLSDRCALTGTHGTSPGASAGIGETNASGAVPVPAHDHGPAEGKRSFSDDALLQRILDPGFLRLANQRALPLHSCYPRRLVEQRP